MTRPVRQGPSPSRPRPLKHPANDRRISKIRPLQRPRGRGSLAENLGLARHLQGRQRRPAPEILRAGDVPLPVGAHPHGARAQLHDGRRGRALQTRARHERAAPDGLGRLRHAGRERRHGAQGPPQGMDLRQHRRDEEAAPVDGAVARLEPRDRDLRSVLLQAPAADVPRLPQGRAGRAQAIQGELGPGRHDGARQRAGHRRPWLALGRAGRAARADPVVLQDQQLFAKTCSTRWTSSTAGRKKCG